MAESQLLSGEEREKDEEETNHGDLDAGVSAVVVTERDDNTVTPRLVGKLVFDLNRDGLVFPGESELSSSLLKNRDDSHTRSRRRVDRNSLIYDLPSSNMIDERALQCIHRVMKESVISHSERRRELYKSNLYMRRHLGFLFAQWSMCLINGVLMIVLMARNIGGSKLSDISRDITICSILITLSIGCAFAQSYYLHSSIYLFLDWRMNCISMIRSCLTDFFHYCDLISKNNNISDDDNNDDSCSTMMMIGTNEEDRNSNHPNHSTIAALIAAVPGDFDPMDHCLMPVVFSDDGSDTLVLGLVLHRRDYLHHYHSRINLSSNDPRSMINNNNDNVDNESEFGNLNTRVLLNNNTQYPPKNNEICIYYRLNLSYAACMFDQSMRGRRGRSQMIVYHSNGNDISNNNNNQNRRTLLNECAVMEKWSQVSMKIRESIRSLSPELLAYKRFWLLFFEGAFLSNVAANVLVFHSLLASGGLVLMESVWKSKNHQSSSSSSERGFLMFVAFGFLILGLSLRLGLASVIRKYYFLHCRSNRNISADGATDGLSHRRQLRVDDDDDDMDNDGDMTSVNHGFDKGQSWVELVESRISEFCSEESNELFVLEKHECLNSNMDHNDPNNDTFVDEFGNRFDRFISIRF